MSHKIYIRIVIRIIALAYCVQIISNSEWLGLFLANSSNVIISGLVVCIAEIFIIRKFLGNQYKLLWSPFGAKRIWHALLAFLLILMLTTLSVKKLDQHKVLEGLEGLPVYLLAFFLNLVPNALTEEWIFRFFPTVITKNNSVFRTVLFYGGVTIVFMLIHLPKFYINGHLDDLGKVFTAGVTFFVIYLVTRNLPFVVLVHAFTNKAWFVYDSSSNWLFLYSSIALVSICWGIGNLSLRRELREAGEPVEITGSPDI